MVDVTDGADVHVWLTALKFLFRHCFLCSCEKRANLKPFHTCQALHVKTLRRELRFSG
jgi:hypothetical protein